MRRGTGGRLKDHPDTVARGTEDREDVEQGC